MTISAVLIVKNEELLLPRCLDSVKGVDEIIVVDTGSTDKTIEVAKKYTDKVYTDFTWCDSFAKARNHALKKATSDWVLSIDADEFLHDLGEVKKAIVLAEKRKVIAIDVTMISESRDTDNFFFPRLFKRVPQIWWEGNIHNHLSVLGTKLGDVKITYGYSPAHTADPDRAFRILQKDVKEKGGSREMFYLGREYFVRGMFSECVQILGPYVVNSKFLAEKADAFLTMAKAYWAMSDGNSARDACVQALIINAHFKEAILFMAKISGKGSGTERWEANARQWEKMAETATNENVLFIRDES